MHKTAAAYALLAALLMPGAALAQAKPQQKPAPAPMAPANSVTDGDCVAMTNVAMQASQKQGGQISQDALAGAMFFTGRLSARDAATARNQLTAARTKLQGLKPDQAQGVLNRCAQMFRDNMQRMGTYVPK